MHAEIYEKLRQHYHLHPLGFPQTKNGVELKILERLFTEEQAQIALDLTPRLERVEELAERLGKDRTELLSILESMADKGLILRVGEKENRRYVLIPFLPGMYEFQLKALDEALAKDFEAFYHDLAKEMFSSQTPFGRVVPVEKNLPVELEVQPYEQASEIIKQAGKISLAECICRKEKKLMGAGCDKPKDDICLSFSPAAEQWIENDLAKEISQEEALKAIKRGEQAGLVRVSLNVQKRSLLLCQCCSCCCAILRGISELEIPTAVAKSNFIPTIDIESCNGCEACVKICPMSALSLRDEKAAWNPARCIGCGLCVSECPLGSIALERTIKKEITSPPESYTKLMTVIAHEKGRTYFYK